MEAGPISRCAIVMNSTVAFQKISKTLLKALCTTETGDAVRSEIDRWRADQIDVAVRDDATAPQQPLPCSPKTERAAASFYVKCRAHAWRVWRRVGHEIVDVRPGPQPDPARLQGFDMMGLRHRFEDWVSPSIGTAPANLHANYGFTTELTVERRPVHVQIAGTLEAAVVSTRGHAPVRLDLDQASPQPVGGGVEAIVVQPRAHAWDSSNDGVDDDVACDVPLLPADANKTPQPRAMECLVLRSTSHTVPLDITLWISGRSTPMTA